MTATVTNIQRRNTEIIRRYAQGESAAQIARKFSITRRRVQEIVTRHHCVEAAHDQLVAQFGESPDIASLPDTTSIDVLALCNVKIHGWRVRLSSLIYAHLPIATLGDLRKSTNKQLLSIPNVGQRFVTALRKHCPWRSAADDVCD